MEGTLLLDAATLIDLGGGGGKPRKTNSVFFKTTGAAVLSLNIPRPLALVYCNSSNALILSRVSDSYASQNPASNFLNAQVIAWLGAGHQYFGNSEFIAEEILYVCASTGLQGTLVFAEISTENQT